MFKRYFIIALRSLYKNKLYSIINIIGLGVAMAMCVVGYVNYQFSQSFDSAHQNADHIYLVNSYRMSDDVRENWSLIPIPMAPAFKNDIPGIEKFSRVSTGGGTFRHEDKVFNELIHYVDEDFFDIFTFPLIAGNQGVSLGHNGLIISDRLAEKFFEGEDPIGKQIIIRADGDLEYEFIVRGVIDRPEKNSSMILDACVPFERVKDLRGFELAEWDKFTRATFIQVMDNTSPTEIERKLQTYTQIVNNANEDFQFSGFYLTPLRQLANTTHELLGDPFNQGLHPAAIIAPSVTALLVLLLACFNFINTSIAFSSRRLKEIGIRKVIGGRRGQLVMQFLGENIVLCLVAIIVAAALAEIFVPAYDSLWPELDLKMNYYENLGMVGFLVGLLLFTAVAAGAYPAFYISKFNPISIFRGKLKLGGTNPLIRILLTFQLALSMTAIIAALVLGKNAEYIETFNLGYDQENILVLPVNGEDEYKIMKSAVSDNPNIINIGATRHLMGHYIVYTDVEIEQRKTRVNLFDIGENYFETVGLELVEGRTFDSGRITDMSEAAIVNETLVKKFGWENALDKAITFQRSDSTAEYRIVGVVKDFHINGVESRLRPTVLRLASKDRLLNMPIKMGDDVTGTASRIETTWKKLFPHRPYEGFWLDDVLNGQRQVNRSIKLVFLYIAVMVIVISGMGLFALVSLNIARRTKELGIRKILGASISNISFIIIKEFILLIVIGGVLASVLAYFLLNSLMGSIWTYYCEFSLAPYALAAVIVLAVAILTVGFQTFKAALANPVDSLRHE
ncbi:MAG: FtsX-like permease family protein [candidate division Zixibacteria bacterium]|nr:FtsX-like permease family protein [candidate division Zixibacteria bacterium]